MNDNLTEHTWEQTWCNDCEADQSWCDFPPVDRPGYEYSCQWYQEHGIDSWIATGWHEGKWTTLDNARYEREVMVNGIWKEDQIRIVRRRKAGPVEVIE